MLNQFYFKFFLFCIILLLFALILHTKQREMQLPIFIEDEVAWNTLYKNNEYYIYVSDMNQVIFPLNIITKEKDHFKMSYYDEKIVNEKDRVIYMTFSLLTNYSNYLPIGTKTFVPQSTKLNSYKVENNVLTLELSDSFLNYNTEVESDLLKIITYTFTEIEGIDKVKLTCNNQEIQFQHHYKNVFSKHDFPLNVFVHTSPYNDVNEYPVYYLTNVNNQYFLVPSRVIIEKNTLSKEENIQVLLTNTLNLPVISFVKTENLEAFEENLSYYQYYLTCIDNNIKERDQTIDLRNINFYEIEFE